MKTFFGSIFVEEEKLKEAGVKGSIKLEYYKITKKSEMGEEVNNKYGIKIVKTQYLENEEKVEEKLIEDITTSEESINKILQILKNNEVTPIAMQDVICDLSKSLLVQCTV